MLIRWLTIAVLIVCINTSHADEKSNTENTFRPQAIGFTPPLLIKGTDLDQYVGRVIAIRGPLSDTKVPTILGIDVACPDDKLRGKDAYAVGILMKWTVTQKQLDEAFSVSGPFATRGPGTSYVLYHSLSGTRSPAKAWPTGERRKSAK
ncbi:hypothetical protein AB1K70_26320 [Bremerella sp. JC770]|uniref:hypothetical protein n=1 Tax=Bremerella sp. JC770 TaxID=3232137 RepID=UPI00345A343F